MVVTIHQPDFLPWLGFFHRWQAADLLILLDDVKFIRRGWHHRDRIKTKDGVAWLTLPVRKKGRFDQTIQEVEIDPDSNWPVAGKNRIRAAYGAAPAFDRVFPEIAALLDGHTGRMIDLNRALLAYAADRLGIETPVRLASDENVTETRTARLVELVRRAGGSVYLTGSGSRGYLEEERFARAGIAVRWQVFDHPEYPQLHGPFASMLSVLDFLMMHEDPAEAFHRLVRRAA